MAPSHVGLERFVVSSKFTNSDAGECPVTYKLVDSAKADIAGTPTADVVSID